MFILSFMGTMPIGNIIAGAFSHYFGAPHTLAAGGIIVTIIVTIVSISNKRLRELY
jgi:fructose-specific phosphotransferase system IIC component